MLQLSIALVGVLNLALSLEDPFDNSGMDGIFIDEALYEVEQVSVLWCACCAEPAVLSLLC